MTNSVGFIGLGNMGLPLASNLVRSGARVLGYSKAGLDAFAHAGGIAAGSAAEVAGQCDIILHSLPSVEALEDVIHGAAGTLGALRPGATVIELSTYPLEVKQRLAGSLASVGATLLDCEISGTPARVAERDCVIMVSGDRAVADRMQPLLSKICARAVYLGVLGASLKAKLINNLLGAVHLAAAAEAIRLGERAGIDPAVLVDLLARGASSSAMLCERGPRMAARRYSDSSGTLGGLYKYLDMGEALIGELGATAPLVEAMLPVFRRALEMGRGDEDTSVIFEATP